MRDMLAVAWGALSFLLVLTPLFAEETPRSDVKSDKEAIQGEWLVTAYVAEGAEAPVDILKKTRVVFAKDRFQIKSMPVHSQDLKKNEEKWTAESDFEAKFSLSMSDESKWITIIDKEMDKIVLQGIYALKGNELKICFSLVDGPPKEFESKVGSTTRLLKLKRPAD
jgi:uncharacterized protein (TIGR03067 family)